MSVMLETSLGELVIDLEVERCPRTCENFLKLCKIKYYALNAFFNVSKDFIAQTGDPTASGTGGQSLASYLHSLAPRGLAPSRYYPPEMSTKLKHLKKGTVSMAVSPTDPPGCGSQFFITLADGIEYLDGKHAVFGHVLEGLDTLDRINEAYLDREGRPLQDIRIRHVEILEDPFPDPSNIIAIPQSPTRPPDLGTSTVVRISDEEDPTQQLAEDDAEILRRKTAAASSALTLEMIGDIPFAAVRPPENILFVCKLNPVTQDEDLDTIFSRFGKILSCEVVRDKRSGDSLQYAFIEFDERESAEQAYFKMQNVLVDDRRIWVDFSQSVAKMNVSSLTSRPRGRGGHTVGRGRGSGRGGGEREAPGYGGRGDLKEASRYRHDERNGGRGGGEGRHGNGAEYGMVFEDLRGDRDERRKRSRNRSPRIEREGGERRDKGGYRERSRSRERYKEERGDRDQRDAGGERGGQGGGRDRVYNDRDGRDGRDGRDRHRDRDREGDRRR